MSVAMFWEPNKFETVKFKSDEFYADIIEDFPTALNIDDELFAYPHPFIEFENAEVQLVRCSCLNEGCAVGNWVSLRIFNNSIVLIPCFKRINEEEDIPFNYDPPISLTKYGIPLFTEEKFPFPIKTRLKKISFVEIALIYEWRLPKHVLRVFSDFPHIESEKFICSLNQDLNIVLEYLESTLLALLSNKKPIINSEFTETVIVFDDPSFTEWSPFESLHFLCGEANNP